MSRASARHSKMRRFLLFFLFSKNSPNLANQFQPNFPESFETVVLGIVQPEFLIFVCEGQEGRKTP